MSSGCNVRCLKEDVYKRQIWGTGGVMFISILILVTTLGCTHATIYGSARPYYAMAKEGLFFKFMSKLNSSHVPANVVWIQLSLIHI